MDTEQLLGWKADQPRNIDEMESDSHVVEVQVTTSPAHFQAEEVHFDGKWIKFTAQPRKNGKNYVSRLLSCLLHFKI